MGSTPMIISKRSAILNFKRLGNLKMYFQTAMKSQQHKTLFMHIFYTDWMEIRTLIKLALEEQMSENMDLIFNAAVDVWL